MIIKVISPIPIFHSSLLVKLIFVNDILGSEKKKEEEEGRNQQYSPSTQIVCIDIDVHA